MTKNTDIQKLEFDETLMDFSAGMPLVTVEKQEIILTEFDKRREFFRGWLKSHLVEGVHYGYPPGCKPTYDQDGYMVQKYYDKRSGTYKSSRVDPAQWKAKPSLYKAGALLIVDLLPIRPDYKTDEGAWKMNGEQTGVFFRTCTLHNAATNEYLGQGTGAFKVNEKGMNENAAIKMADKRALVAAVINTIPLVADLFTQDMEEGDIPKPKSSRKKAKMGDAPESEWTTRETDIEKLWSRIDSKREGEGMSDKAFVDVVTESLFGSQKNVADLTLAEFRTLTAALGEGLFSWSDGERIPQENDDER